MHLFTKKSYSVQIAKMQDAACANKLEQPEAFKEIVKWGYPEGLIPDFGLLTKAQQLYIIANAYPPAGKIIVKGTIGEYWMSLEDDVRRSYNCPDDIGEDFIVVDTIVSKNAPCFCARKAKEIERVKTKQGDILYTNKDGIEHGEGDYIVYSMNIDGSINTNDAWVVNGLVFKNTYEPIE